MMGAMADRLEANLDVIADTREFEARFTSLMVSEQRRVFLLCRRMLNDPAEADSAGPHGFHERFQGLVGVCSIRRFSDRAHPGRPPQRSRRPRGPG